MTFYRLRQLIARTPARWYELLDITMSDTWRRDLCRRGI